MLRTWVRGCAAAAAGLVAACGATDAELRTFVGPVLELDDTRICIGGAEATGECFVQTGLTRGLRLGDCVRVSYRMDVRESGYAAEAIEVLGVDAGRGECS